MFVLDGGKTAMRKLGSGVLVLGLLWLSLPAAAEISGELKESGSLTPIVNGIVGLQNTETVTNTDPNGRFSLPIPSGTGLVITGAAKDYYINAVLVSAPASGVQILLDPTPTGQAANYIWLTPDVDGCGACHPDPVGHWTLSLMAKTGLNQWVYDMYNGTGTAGGMGGFVYVRDSMHAATNPKGECGACHQPERWIKDPNKPALDDISSPSQEALHGISCEVCHKVGNVNEANFNLPGFYPGAATVTLPDFGLGEGQVEYGTLWDVTYRDSFPPLQPGSMRASYQPQLVAELCALCHEDRNDLDQDQQFNDVPARETYSEWLASDYGDPNSPSYKTCVDCHMEPYGGSGIICNVPGAGLPRDPNTIGTHRIEGTTAEFLEEAVELTMQVTQGGGQIEVEVSIENTETGHHVPSGESMRNVILLVEAWRVADGSPLSYTGTQTVDELGGIGDPNQGYYADLPGKFYAKVLEDPNGKSPVMFTEAAMITSDNRIAAFDTDTTQYSFAAPAGGGLVHIRARLIYRRTFRLFLDEKGWTQDGHGESLKDIEPPDFGHLMEEAEQDVNVDEASPLSKQDQKCVNSINKGAAKVAKSQGGDTSSCIKNAGKGKLLPGQTIEQCVVSDPKGKVDKAIGKIQTDKCPSPPAFPDLISTTDQQVIGDLMVAKELALVHAIFGTDLDESGLIVSCDDDKPGCGCQAAVIKAAQKCQDTKLKEFGACKKNAIKVKKDPLPAGALNAAELQDACMGTGSGSIPDPKNKISGKCADFGTGKKCGGLDLATYFPGTPSVGEIDIAIECEVCKVLNALDGLSRDCDEFDNGLTDGSCL
jgi:hypothetical protein